MCLLPRGGEGREVRRHELLELGLGVAAVQLHALHDLIVVVDLKGGAEVEEDLLLVLGHLAIDDLGQRE